MTPPPALAACPLAPRLRRRPRLLAAATLSLFAVSFLLPAYGSGDDPARGWACQWLCIQLLDRHCLQSPGQLYYFGFTVTNLLFCVLCVRRLRLAPPTWITRAGALLILGHVLSWLVLNLPLFSNDADFMIRPGYFVWLLAFALLAVGEWTAPRGKAPA